MRRGLLIGFLLAAVLGRFVRTLLFDLQPLDPVSFMVAGIVLIALTIPAALLPRGAPPGLTPSSR